MSAVLEYLDALERLRSATVPENLIVQVVHHPCRPTGLVLLWVPGTIVSAEYLPNHPCETEGVMR